MKSHISTIVIYTLVIFIVILSASMLLGNMNEAEELSYSEIIDMFYDDKVTEFSISSGNVLTFKTTDGKIYSRTLRDLGLFLYDIDDYLVQYRSRRKTLGCSRSCRTS